jgi:hypothetical protein
LCCQYVGPLLIHASPHLLHSSLPAVQLIRCPRPSVRTAARCQ